MTRQFSRVLAILGVSALATLSLQAAETYNIDMITQIVTIGARDDRKMSVCPA